MRLNYIHGFGNCLEPLKENKMYASIYNARKATGFKHELTLHNAPSLADSTSKIVSYYMTKTEAKQAAKQALAKPWNY